ncbi:MAG: tripartite tricarboxylate transporter substrate-binding protein [Micropepsaceae bacterium]
MTHKSKHRCHWVVSALAFLALLMTAGTASAQEPNSEFFRGKTLTYIVSTNPGGGYDYYGRLMARYLEKYLPVSRVIVRNVPGAGHIIGANTIYTSRPDGLTIGVFNTGLIYSQLLQASGVRFDLNKMSWIGKMAGEGRTLIFSTRSGLVDIDDLFAADEVLLAAAGVGSAAYTETRILMRVLNLENARLIPGFIGNEIELSMLRGEVQGTLSVTSTQAPFVERGEAKYIVAIAGTRSAIEGIPQVRDFVSDPENLQLLSLVENMAELGRLTAGPPEIAPATLAVLRQAFEAAMNDSGLLGEANRMQVPMELGTGDEVAAMVETALDQPAHIVELLREAATEQ